MIKKTIQYSLFFFQGFKKEITNLLHNVSGKDCKYRHMNHDMQHVIQHMPAVYQKK